MQEEQAWRDPIKSKLACILETSESTRLRVGESLPSHHEDHIAGKGDNSLQHYNLVHKFIPMPQAVKIPDAKAAVDKEWKKLETIPAWNLESQEQKGENSGSTKRQEESPLCFIDGHVSPQQCGVRTKITVVQRQSRAPGGHCKRRLWSLCSFS